MLSINFEKGGGEVLDRIIDAYGFTSKIDYCNHLNISASSLSMRYKRQIFPSDLAIRCIAETGVTLDWLVTGQGKKFNDESLDTLKFSRKKLIDGQLYDSGYLLFDKAMLLPGVPQLEDPIGITHEKTQYIVERKFSDVYDGEWLVEIEEKTSIRTLTRIPIRKVRISGVGMAFDCNIEDINIIGKVILTITSF
ncbi:phage repressor protein CI [Hafnia alvei]|uniref:phage repressor protein CI n=1 Tax=Hafnia alvei TaxID=569 RepID=UPI0024A9D3F9|nr:phage repressor protein CI [Hafnia alvei]